MLFYNCIILLALIDVEISANGYTTSPIIEVTTESPEPEARLDEGCRNETHYTCKNQECVIPTNARCDGIVQCQEKSDEADCLPIGCFLPEQPIGGSFEVSSCSENSCNVTAGERISNDSFLTYSCNEGYTLQGNNVSFCHIDVWDQPPTCVKICPELNSSNVKIVCKYRDSIVPCNSAIIPRTKATLECKELFTSPDDSNPGNKEITCLEGGKWDHPGLQCVPEGLIEATTQLAESETRHYEECRNETHYTCKNGQCVIPSTARCDGIVQCEDKSDEVNCPPVGCFLPEQPIGGSFEVSSCSENSCNVTAGDRISNDSFLTYSCNEGYTLQGNNVSFCHIDVWDQPPTCVKICPELNSSSVNIVCKYRDSIVPCNSAIIPGTKVTMECKELFTTPDNSYPGNKEITCLEEGKWDHPAVLHCVPEALNEVDAQLTETEFRQNEECRNETHYTCKNQECVIPANARCDGVVQCHDKSDEADCPLIGCFLPEQPIGGSFEVSSCSENSCNVTAGERIPSNSSLTYKCNEGYTLQGNNVTFCRINVWDQPPACIKICPDLNSSSVNIVCKYKDGIVSCNSAIIPGTKATLECKDLFTTPDDSNPGIKEITCLDEGKWDHPALQCVPEESVEVITLPAEWETKHNEECRMKMHYICKNNQCVFPSTARCDGIVQCEDKSDEVDCPTIGCILPEQPIGGSFEINFCSGNLCNVTAGRRVPNYSSLHYRCDMGYTLREGHFSFCYRNIWYLSPSCVLTCPELKSTTVDIVCKYDNETVPCNSTIVPGTTATLACKESYTIPPRIIPNHKEITCLAKGGWSHPMYKCVPNVCGRAVPLAVPAIYNGKNASFGEFPWHVGIYSEIESNEYEQQCGGTLISHDLVVSAAHCFWDDRSSTIFDPSSYAIAAGKISREFLDPEKENPQYSKVQGIQVPKFYGHAGQFSNDIALVRLERPIAMSDSVMPVCIDWEWKQESKDLTTGKMGKVMGWGLTESNKPSSELRKVELPYIPREDCIASVPSIFKHIITPDKFCAGYVNGSGLCKGDSGGGYCFESEGVWYLHGIVSCTQNTWDLDVCNNHYTAITNTTYFLDWIGEALFVAE